MDKIRKAIEKFSGHMQPCDCLFCRPNGAGDKLAIEIFNLIEDQYLPKLKTINYTIRPKSEYDWFIHNQRLGANAILAEIATNFYRARKSILERRKKNKNGIS
jgi:hypothetical protein